MSDRIERERKLPFLLLSSITHTAHYVRCSRTGPLECNDFDITSVSVLASRPAGWMAREYLETRFNWIFVSIQCQYKLVLGKILWCYFIRRKAYLSVWVIRLSGHFDSERWKRWVKIRSGRTNYVLCRNPKP